MGQVVCATEAIHISACDPFGFCCVVTTYYKGDEITKHCNSHFNQRNSDVVLVYSNLSYYACFMKDKVG